MQVYNLFNTYGQNTSNYTFITHIISHQPSDDITQFVRNYNIVTLTDRTCPARVQLFPVETLHSH